LRVGTVRAWRGGGPRWGFAAGAAGAWAAPASLEAGVHDEALSLVYELVTLGSRRSLRRPGGQLPP
jgi:hypothetical protein